MRTIQRGDFMNRSLLFPVVATLGLLAAACATTPQEKIAEGDRYLTVNKEKARAFYDSACNDGSMEGCHKAGLTWLSGDAPSAENEKGRTLIDKACNGGYDEACHTIGDMWRYGRSGVFQDYASAAGYYEKLCEKKFAKACRSLGEMHAKGLGMPKNVEKAKELFD